MRHLLIKDKKRRILFKKREINSLILKYFLFNIKFNINMRFHANCFFKRHLRSFKTRLRNRCVKTNRSRFLFVTYKLSRLEFRRLAVLGYLNGIYARSW